MWPFPRDLTALSAELSAMGVGQIPLSGIYDTFILGTIETPFVDAVLPTPYSAVADHILHASPVFVRNGLGGYCYWMAYTPYPNSNSEYENPCIAASMNGLVWELPQGANNPLFERPTEPGYNSDVNLTLHPSRNELILLWRVRNAAGDGKNRLMLSTSSNGVTWSSPVALWEGTTAASSDMASPSLCWDEENSQWVILGFNLDDAGKGLRSISSASLESGWSATPTELTMAAPSGRKWWHGQFIKVGSGYFGVVQDNDGTGGNPGYLYSVCSSNGSAFYVKRLITEASDSWYKPGLCLVSTNTEVKVMLALSKLSTSYIRMSSLLANKNGMTRSDWNTYVISIISSAREVPTSVLWADDFVRADSDASLGTSTSGGEYTQTGSGSDIIGISGNRAYPVSTGNCRVWCELGNANHEVGVTYHTMGTQAWVIARFTDTNNYFRLGLPLSGGVYTFQKIAGGALALNVGVARVGTAGDSIALRCAGNLIQALVNGEVVYSIYDADNVTATKAGLQISGATPTYMKNFIARAL